MTGDRHLDDGTRQAAGDPGPSAGDLGREEPLDRLIDEAVASALDAGGVDLRVSVLERIDRASHRAEDGRGWGPWRAALLPVAGATVVAVGIGVFWQHETHQVEPARTTAAPRLAPPVTASGPATPVPSTAAAPVSPTSPFRQPERVVEIPLQSPRAGGAAGDTRIAAASWLAMDAASRPGSVTGAAIILDDDPEEPALPGAPAGDLGDPIAPMPKPRPIRIAPIATPPMADAPPVGALGKPISTLSEDTARESKGPGATGGR